MGDGMGVGMEDERDRIDPYALWLYAKAGMGSKWIRRLYSHGGLQTAGQLFDMTEKEGEDLCGAAYAESAGEVGKGTAEKAAGRLKAAIRAGTAQRREEAAERLRRMGIRFVTMEDRLYPERLRNIPDPPFGLYYRGCLPSDDRPSVAVIGARGATRYGIQQARIFSGTLAAAGVQIVSGLAVGVDGAAEEEALYCGGASFGVLGCGVDVCYPERNRRIYERMCAGEHGSGVLSEFPPGEQPKRNYFPARNRLISGLADILLVCEARAQSGTQITADHALDQGRDIFAVPGRNIDALSEGCNRLIRQGAGIAICPQDLLGHFFGSGAGEESQPEEGDPQKQDPESGEAGNGGGELRLADPVQQALFESLDAADLQEMDALREKMEEKLGRGVSIREAGAVMSKLMLLGYAQEPCSGYYCRAIEKGAGKR